MVSQTSQPSPEEAVTRVFRQQYRLLAALFPRDGEVMVARAAAVARTLVRQTGLSRVNPEQLAAKIIACHHLGLEVGDQASLVPYGDGVELVIGPRGLIALAYRSGFVKSIVARSVFEADHVDGLWDYDLGDSAYIRHRKAPAGRRARTSTITDRSRRPRRARGSTITRGWPARRQSSAASSSCPGARSSRRR